MMMFLELKRKLNLIRRYRYWDKEGCIFIHVPKGAGTSINKALYGRTLGHYTANEVSRAFPKLYERSFTFSFVRNPWDRVLSAYKFAKAGRTESMGIYKPEQYAIEQFDTFERFVLGWLPRQDLNRTDFVFRKQVDFLCNDDKEVMVEFVGKVENIEIDIKGVEQRTGKSIIVGRSNSTRSSEETYQKSYITSEMIEVVADVYKEDIAAFGYTFFN